MNKLFNKLRIVLVATLVAALASCSDDETTPAPVAGFAFEVNATNSLMVNFSDNSENGETYAWDFGDGTGTSTEENPSYIYTEGGTYTVTLTVTNEGGSDKSTAEVTVVKPIVDLITNGSFDNDSGWTVISHNTSGNGVLTIADGVATFDEAIDVPSGYWGDEAHMGMYQKIEVSEAGDYQLDLDITINGFEEVWFQVWVGSTEPVEGGDYGDPAVKILEANAWDCNDTQGTYSGSLADNYCDPNGEEDGLLDGKISLTAGTHYVVIRSGGFTFGEGGIVVDNVSMDKIN